MKENGVIQEYTGSLSRQIREEYHISEEYYHGEIKRGLRNSDGTGVMVGVTKVGSVQGYLLQDGQRIPIPGRLYYRGIELNDIVEAHRAEGTFGFEEVAYLLLMGYLPSQGELRHFNEIMNRARKLPEGFTEGMIMRRTSGNIMNELGRSILSLYSYDPDPDDLSVDNLLRQSVELIGYFPSIVANAYAVKRHHFGGESLHIHYPEEGLSTAENFLRMIRPDKSYTEEEAHLLDMMLMLHAEHGGGNNSTFVVPGAVLQRYGYLQRHRRSGGLPEGAAPRRRQRQGHGDVPLHSRRMWIPTTTDPSGTIWCESAGRGGRAIAPASSTVWATPCTPCRIPVRCC